MSKSFCKHEPDMYVDNTILEPNYSKDMVYISTAKVGPHTEHFVFKFVKCNKYPDWYYLSGKEVRKAKQQPNGRGFVYTVPMSKCEDFTPIVNCEHEYK